MKKVSIRQEFDYPLATLLQAREERYKHLDRFPELKNVHIIEEHREGGRLKQTRHIDLGESLPQAISVLLPHDAKIMVETSEFDEENHEHTFRVTPGGGFDNIFTIKGVSRYHSLGETHSARDYEIEISSKALFVGLMVESAIADVYGKNIEKDRISILNFIKELGLHEPAGGNPTPAAESTPAAEDVSPADGGTGTGDGGTGDSPERGDGG